MSEFVTLDGVMEAPGGEPTHPHTGWVVGYFSPELQQYKLDEVLDAESLLLGRITYESFLEGWPAREGVFAEKMNSMPKHVATSAPADLTWHATALQGDVATAVQALKAMDGGPMLVAGSATLVHTLLLHGLVDELRLMVFPVAIGHGLRVFPEDRVKLAWTLAAHEVFPLGVHVLAYRPT